MKRLNLTNSSLFPCAAAILLLAGTFRQANAEATPAPTTPHHLRNISSRAPVQTGDNVLIGGFIVSGSAPKQILIRALGPSLSVNDVPVAGRLADPSLVVYAQGGSTPVASNDNWRSSQEGAITATGLAPTNDLESAVIVTLDPGNCTAVLRGRNNGTGIALLEVYELSSSSDPKLGNISGRGLVQSNDNVLIGGFIVGGGDDNSSRLRLIVRALGPSLTASQVPSALADPTLDLYDANGTSVASNDNWRDGNFIDLQASGFAPPNDFESALIVYLLAGNYTAIVRGHNQSSGIALVEVYDVPDPSSLPPVALLDPGTVQ